MASSKAVLTLWGEREPGVARRVSGEGRSGAERVARHTGVSPRQPCCGVCPCPEDNRGHWRDLQIQGTAGLPFGKIALEKGFREGRRRQGGQCGGCCEDPLIAFEHRARVHSLPGAEPGLETSLPDTKALGLALAQEPLGENTLLGSDSDLGPRHFSVGP